MRARIVIVDDEPDVAELFRQQFRKRRASSWGARRLAARQRSGGQRCDASPSWVYAS